MHVALRGAFSDAHHIGDLLVGLALLIPKDKRHPVLWPEAGHRLREITQTQSMLCLPVWSRVAGHGHPGVGRVFSREEHGVGTATSKRIDGRVVSNPKDPGREATMLVKGVEPSKRLEKRLLGELLCDAGGRGQGAKSH